jgi:membrane protease YdiL (CAAX protease family)
MTEIKRLSWSGLFILFAWPAILNLIACRIAIPLLDSQDLFPIEFTYFICVGLLVLVPMFFAAIAMSLKETDTRDIKTMLTRMRIKKLTSRDVLWTCGTFIFLVLASFIIAKRVMPVFGLDATPFFFQNMPLADDYRWILFVWPVFFFFNIFGEEFYWRGYIQPRQELLNRKWTWFVHGLLWACWHLPMGTDLIIASTPIFFILPAVVQIRKNTSIALIVHFVFGAFGFLSLSFGMVH